MSWPDVKLIPQTNKLEDLSSMDLSNKLMGWGELTLDAAAHFSK